MAKATDNFRLIRDPAIRAALERAERDLPPAPVVAKQTRPALTCGVLEAV